ncbi:MAG TPA: DUF3556 domain-containing protein [Baekduia sp.]|nr:DUF3556 domain-containing protein [Baekduia sp.]
MGLMTGNFPPVDPATFTQMPYRERLKVLSQHWVDYGFGAPKITMLIYIAKVLVLYMGGGILAATLTSDLDPFHPAAWWDEPIFYQKVVLWTVLMECLNLAGSWGPLAGKFKPWTGGPRYYARLNTLRVPPWPGKVPFTAGDARTPVDVGLYLAALASLALGIGLSGRDDTGLTEAVGANKGLVEPAPVIAAMVFLTLAGLRDKVLFLAARSEQWFPVMIFFAFFPFVDMIVAAKLVIVMIWFGAGISKLNRHFECVIPPMVSNTPWNPVKRFKRLHYRKFPDDLRPSKFAKFMAHGPGAFGELVPPLILLFSHNETLSTATAVFMVCYHVFIISTFPLAIPLEWNVAYAFSAAFLFIGFANHEGYGLGDMDPALLVLVVASMLVLPILGERRPDLVSFLPAFRQYSGNWATAMWAFAPGREEKLDQCIVKAGPTQTTQLADIYGRDEAEVMLHQLLAFRSLHSQARGLNSVMMNQLGDDIDVYTLREAEFICNNIIGFNFGDGHFHNQVMLEGIQRRCQYKPGEFIVVWVESEPIGNGRQEYWVWDCAEGIVERGSWSVKEAVEELNWLPNGPMNYEVTWRKPGYQRVSYAQDAQRDSRVTAPTSPSPVAG